MFGLSLDYVSICLHFFLYNWTVLTKSCNMRCTEVFQKSGSSSRNSPNFWRRDLGEAQHRPLHSGFSGQLFFSVESGETESQEMDLDDRGPL